MSNTAALAASPIPTVPWHIGITPGFPPSLLLSNDSAIESLLTDIPFLSVGLLGFGVLTFFFTMRKFDRIALYIFASAIVAFIAGVLDVGQVLIRGRAATDSDSEVSSVLPLLIARELLLACSIGIRFFFFWSFVLLPPRGEHPELPRSDTQERPNFLRLKSDYHSANWMRWGLIGGFLKYILLFAVLAIPVLQTLWRLVGQFSQFGPIYDTDGILEMVVSALFIIKLLANTWLSPLTPRWKTVRDYSPVIAALMISVGVGVGNILRFEFSETSLGRFLQAVELYVLVLYILISSFYKQRVRVSMLGTSPSHDSKILVNAFEGSNHVSSPQPTPTTGSAPDIMHNLPPPRLGDPSSRDPSSRPGNRLSSWLIPDADMMPTGPNALRRMSTTEKLTSWIASRRISTRQEQVQSRSWDKIDMERGTSPIDTTTGYAISPESSTDPREAAAPKVPLPMLAASQRLDQSMPILDAPLSFRNGGSSPDGTISSFAGVENYSRKFIPPRLPNNIPGSPVYGLDGIVGYYGQPSPEPRKQRSNSVQSSGMESLLRQQAELDKSVAELQLFSPGLSLSTGERAVGGQPESFRSEFSLSNFPDPPLNAPAWMREVVEVLRTDEPEAKDPRPSSASLGSAGESTTARTPRKLTPTTPPRRRQSFPSTTRSSSDSAVLGTASRVFVGSGGTQYDVTSFIGDLTAPVMSTQADKARRPVSLVIEQPDSETLPNVEVTPAAVPVPPITVQAPAPPATVAGLDATTALRSSPPRRLKQGLPSRIKLNISGPISRAPSIERSMAYERPRPVPPA